jgi:hypothetical protein
MTNQNLTALYNEAKEVLGFPAANKLLNDIGESRHIGAVPDSNRAALAKALRDAIAAETGTSASAVRASKRPNVDMAARGAFADRRGLDDPGAALKSADGNIDPTKVYMKWNSAAETADDE